MTCVSLYLIPSDPYFPVICLRERPDERARQSRRTCYIALVDNVLLHGNDAGPPSGPASDMSRISAGTIPVRSETPP